MNKITAIVLTKNEEKHIARCLRSLAEVVDQVIVVDSGSSDNTLEICREMQADVYENQWKNYASQFNWALDNCDVRNEWCLRIDADEYLTGELRVSLRENVLERDVPEGVSGFYMNRVMFFLGQKIRYGGCGRLFMLRLFRFGVGRCETRWMDEHIVLSGGRTERLSGQLIDENHNNIGWWTDKHNNYASREAIDLLNVRYGFLDFGHSGLGDVGEQAGLKRFFKEKVYVWLPSGFRAILYFLWRYFFRLGFLDGRSGFIFHFLQGFWYRFLVDVKVRELEERARKSGVNIAEVIEQEYGFRVVSSRGDT